MEIPESCYQLLDPQKKEQIGTILSAALRVAADERINSVAITQDNFAAPVCEAIRERFGAKGAARLFIAAYGNLPVLPPTSLHMTWHGLDLDATLDSFVDWCEAIHAGVKAPPLPFFATF